MPRRLAELRPQERLHEIPGHGRSYDARTDAEEVHVIVLDSPSRRVVVVNQSRTPGILFAQIEAPTPLPQTATPRSTAPAAARASGTTKSG